jgi:hypothetical protein
MFDTPPFVFPVWQTLLAGNGVQGRAGDGQSCDAEALLGVYTGVITQLKRSVKPAALSLSAPSVAGNGL